MGKELWIKNGYLVNPGAGQEGLSDIFIRDGKIAAVRFLSGAEDNVNRDSSFDTTEDAEVIDAKGCYVFPGLVDAHSHFRDPGFTYKEDIFSGAEAAAAGGYTDVVLMCNTNPTVDNIETLRYVLEKGKKTKIHVHSCGTVTLGLKGETITDMEALKEAGAVGFTDDGIPLMNPEILREAMKKSTALNMTVSLHEEDKTLISENGINRGKASDHFGIKGSPKEAEISLIRRDLEIAISENALVDIQHVSAKESVELIRQAVKSQGENRTIHAEATPQHFVLTEDALITIGANAKLNPPLRTEEDRLGIIEGLKDNTIDLIATDHAPHSEEEKNREITKAPSGMLGLETALSLAYEELVLNHGIPLKDVIAKLTCNPASVYGLDAGVIKEGGKADLCIFNPQTEYTVEGFHSKSSNSPFLGRKMQGRVLYTICEGEVVYQV